MTIVSYRVSATGDDGTHRSVSSHVYDIAAAELQIGFLGSAENLASWMRFLNVQVPQGSFINSAKLTLTAWRSDSGTTVNGRIDAEKAPDSGAPSHAEFDGGSVQPAEHEARRGNRTATLISWPSIPATTVDLTYDSPDIKAVIQEIVDQATWQSGNAITIYVGDEDEQSTQSGDTRRIFKGWDNAPTEAPLLTIDYIAPVLMPSDYEILLRDPRTLALRGILGQFTAATWTRRTLRAGEFTIHVHSEQLDSLTLIDPETVVEIRRDSALEFVGVCTRQEYDAITGIWELTGPDLKGFHLANRLTDPGASEFDAQIAVKAEVALNHYVKDHLTAPTDSDRDVNNELTGIAFTVQDGSSRGANINYNARWQNLLEVLVEIGDASAVDLWYDVVILDPLGYHFQVEDYVDRTEGETDAVVFSIGFDNVGEAVYVHDTTRLVTSVYVLGPGSGAGRTVLEVKDTTEETNHFRREGRLDSRQADSADIRAEEGNREIARSVLGKTAARVAPLLAVDGSLYRTNWDLGYDVTLAFPVISKTLDQRIVEVIVTLSDKGEEIGVGFDSPPQTLTTLIAQLVKRSQRVQVA